MIFSFLSFVCLINTVNEVIKSVLIFWEVSESNFQKKEKDRTLCMYEFGCVWTLDHIHYATFDAFFFLKLVCYLNFGLSFFFFSHGSSNRKDVERERTKGLEFDPHFL